MASDTARKSRLHAAWGCSTLPRLGLKKWENRMATGTLKMWNAERGYGFIGDDAGGPDMFLHISALQSSGIDPDNIRKGERLSFDVESTREGKTRASNVRRPG